MPVATVHPTDHDDATLERSPDRASRRRSRRRLAVVGIASLVLAFGAATLVPYLLRNEPAPLTVDEALEKFRESSSSAPAPASSSRPAAGIYVLDGEGSESISFPPLSQDDGAVMPASVEHLADGCWRWRLNYNTAHWHELDFCRIDGDVAIVAQRNYQSWDLGAGSVENRGEYTCDPPSRVVPAEVRPGEVSQHRCTGTNTAVDGESVASGPTTFVGVEMLAIDGVETPALHTVQHRTMSGSQTGTVEEEWWYALDTGLPVRSKRHTELHTDSPIGSITYKESGSWDLRSLQPRV
jgi:hypothetical protein